MSAFTEHSIEIVRLVRQRTPQGGKTTSEVALEGSPFVGCRVYMSRKAEFRGRLEGQAGVTSLQNWILSVPLQPFGVPSINIGDIATLPEGLIPSEVRVRIQRVRPYGSGLQCDLEVGAVAEGKDP